MLIAELKGKIPSKFDDKEDILTSNVFSFFKYAHRQILKSYLNNLSINVSIDEANKAEFIFWPSYEDGTEPDLVIICGKYYMLIEAKLKSDFSPKTKILDSQIDREIKMGKLAAKNLNKEFIYIAITAEYYKPINKYTKYENRGFKFIWTNWQVITDFLIKNLSENKFKHDLTFANDLCTLLIKKKLRSFIGLSNIKFKEHNYIEDIVFYDVQTSDFKGEFTGFVKNLRHFKVIKPYPIKFQKSYFKLINKFQFYPPEKIFYNGK